MIRTLLVRCLKTRADQRQTNENYFGKIQAYPSQAERTVPFENQVQFLIVDCLKTKTGLRQTGENFF